MLLLAALASLLWLADRSARLSPDFLTGFVLYALSATNFMMLLALGFFLVRNVVKLVVERRRALPFARFRAKLVALLLGLTLVPAVLVLAVGSQVVLTAVDRWFNAPMDEVLSSAQHHRLRLLPRAAAGGQRRGGAAGAGAVARRSGQRRRGRARGRSRPTSPSGASGWSRSIASPAGRRACSRWSTSPRPTCPTGIARAGGDRLAAP